MSILFLGGDMRQKYACEFLNKNGLPSKINLNFIIDNNIKSEMEKSKYIVLPVPVSKNNAFINMSNEIRLFDVLDLLNKSHTVFGGKLPAEAKRFFFDKNISFTDFFDIEAFQINNALVSAEGAIYYAKDRFDGSIHGSDIAILGFGRIGKLLSYLLRSQGAKISVYARKEFDLAWSRVNGINAVKIDNLGDVEDYGSRIKKYDIIFNTIPYWVMSERFAERISKKTLIIDLASYPHGIDENLVNKYNLNYHRELGIPGRYAPKTAGEIIGKTIMNNILCKED